MRTSPEYEGAMSRRWGYSTTMIVTTSTKRKASRGQKCWLKLEYVRSKAHVVRANNIFQMTRAWRRRGRSLRWPKHMHRWRSRATEGGRWEVVRFQHVYETLSALPYFGSGSRAAIPSSRWWQSTSITRLYRVSKAKAVMRMWTKLVSPANRRFNSS